VLTCSEIKIRPSKLSLVRYDREVVTPQLYVDHVNSTILTDSF